MIASPGQEVEPRETGRVTIQRDPARQEEIADIYAACRKMLLSHEVYPVIRNGFLERYDVVLYIVNHYHNDLSNVDHVDYALDTGWGDAVFRCADVRYAFAIKIGAVGSFLCAADVIFKDNGNVSINRYIELQPVIR
jgi:hypothetical protein